MSYSPLPGGYQIDVVDQSGRAYRAVFNNLQLVGEMALLPLLIVLAAELVALFLPGGGFVGRLLEAMVELVAFLVFGTIFVVRWHRFILLGESVSGGLFPPGWTPFFIVGVKLGALVFAGWVVLVFVAILPPHLLTIPLTAAGGIALTLFSMRVSLIFPAAAIDRPVGLATAWGWVTGNFWRLFVCLIVCYLPFVIAQFFINAVATMFPALFWIIFEALRLVVSFAGIAVVAALLSHLYREFVDGAPPIAAAD
jgi:hypothetical protein